MNWAIQVGDILDVSAAVLVCSANVHLNLSGGVGGALALRYGPAMQEALHKYLGEHGLPFVQPGTVIEMPPCGTPYRAVLHAVAVDAMYDTSPELVATVVSESLRRAAVLGARSVALPAVGTGYGRLPLAEFSKGVMNVMKASIPPLERVVLGLRSEYDAEELRDLIPMLRTSFDGKG